MDDSPYFNHNITIYIYIFRCSTSIVCERQEISNGFSFKVLHAAWPEPQQNHGGWRFGGHSLPMKCYNGEVKLPTMLYITQKLLAWHQQLVSARLVSTLNLICGCSPEATCLLCVIPFPMKKLSIANLWITKIASCELKSTMFWLQKCASKPSSKEHFHQLYQIRYINSKIIVAASRLGWK